MRDLLLPDDTRQQHAHAAALGREVRISRGVYTPVEQFRRLNDTERYLLRVRAIADTRRYTPVLSHWSAAVIHGLPIIGRWPSEVHLTQPVSNGSRSRNGVVRHSLRLRDSDVVELNGMLVTSLARTIVDMAIIASFNQAVAMADRALHVDRHRSLESMVSRAELFSSWQGMLPFRGHARSLNVLEFAEDAADSPLESVSRVSMRVIGCPAPTLQTPFYDAAGFIGETDFEWPEFGLLGEADGDGKYLDPELRGGRSADRVKLDEKIREDRLRALPRHVARWRWDVATNPRALRVVLAAFGLPMGLPRERLFPFVS